MRTLTSTLTALTIFFILAFASCKKDNNTAPTPTVITGDITSSLTTEGTWHVGAFIDNGVDKTNNLNDFNLSFNKNGSVTAAGSSTVFVGSWWTSNNKTQLKLNIDFTDQGSFQEITHDWTVMQQGLTQIQLMHVATDDGKNTDLLTLNKNMVK